MNSKITEAKIRLKNLIEKYEKQKSINLSEDIITINAKRESFWITLILVCFLIILPISTIFYFIYSNENNLLIGFCVLTAISLWNLLNRIFVGETNVEINFIEKYLIVKNRNLVLAKIYKTRKILFSDIYKSELKIKSNYSEYGTEEWIRLSLTNKMGIKYVITNFDNKFPETLMAKEICRIIELVKY